MGGGKVGDCCAYEAFHFAFSLHCGEAVKGILILVCILPFC